MPSRALWYTSKDRVDLRPVEVAPPADNEVAIRALYSGLSRGTERLVLQGLVPASERTRMRCPRQDGTFPFPVKYGYALVGVVEAGPADRIGQTVFALNPHQERATILAADAHPLPAGLPARRAVLSANMETALTAIWDGGVAPGDKVLVVGGGVIGLLSAALAARIAGTEVTVVDIDPARADLARRLGAAFALPDGAPHDQDVAIHASASQEGLRLALDRAGREASVVEASWYGDRAVTLSLGESFHSRRLRIVSSQVGALPAHRAARWSHARRLRKAMAILADDAFDGLIGDEIPFADAPAAVPRALLDGGGPMTVLKYD